MSVAISSEHPRLAYTVHEGQGPYLILLHGFLSSQRQWLLNTAALSSICRPVTVDLYGHGASPAPEDPESYTVDHYVAEIKLIQEQLGGEPAYLCGYSLGAGIMMRYAHTYPETVRALIITNSQSGFASPELISEWQSGAAKSAEGILTKGKAAIRKIAVHPRFAKRLPDVVYKVLMEDAELLSPVGVANTLLKTNLGASARDIAASNPRPTLLCFGQHEKRFHAAKEWAVANMANLEVAELAAGHAVNMEDADGFNAAVIDFLSRHGDL